MKKELTPELIATMRKDLIIALLRATISTLNVYVAQKEELMRSNTGVNIAVSIIHVGILVVLLFLLPGVHAESLQHPAEVTSSAIGWSLAFFVSTVCLSAILPKALRGLRLLHSIRKSEPDMQSLIKDVARYQIFLG